MDEWVEVGDRVYARRYQPWDVTVGVVVGQAGVLVVDTRATLEQGYELRDDLRRLDPRRPRWVVNTHWHFDHVLGNGAFAPVEIWAHPTLSAAIEPPPDHLVEDTAVVDLGDRAVHLRHLGPGHTDGDVVITVRDAGVVFAGDLVEESGPPAFGDDSFPIDWPATNARLLGLVRDRDRVVPGHGAVVDRRFVAEQQRALDAVARTIRHLWVGEVPVEAALAEGESQGRWPWPADSLADAVARGYWQLEVSAGRGSDG